MADSTFDAYAPRCAVPADFRASWERWAAKTYPEPAVAQAAASGAIAVAQTAAPEFQARVAGHKAAIAAGGEYRCRPDRAGMAIFVCGALMVMFVPATLLGLSTNPAFGGYLFLAGAIMLPSVAIVGLMMVKKNSCFFVDRRFMGRRNWYGQIVFRMPLEGITGVRIKTGDWSDAMLTDRGPQESSFKITSRSGSIRSTDLVFWSNSRSRELVAVVDAARPNDPATPSPPS